MAIRTYRSLKLIIGVKDRLSQKIIDYTDNMNKIDKLIDELDLKMLENRVYQVIGKDLASKMIPLDYSLGNYKVRGLVSGLNQGAVSKKNQYFFVNGRTVSERTLYAALNNSYKNFLEKSMSPAAIILFEIPPAEVDVNIHPTKL